MSFEEFQNRPSPPKMLAVFADPVFSRDDARADSVRLAPKRKGNQTVTGKNVRNLTGNDKTAKRPLNRDFVRTASDVGLITGESAELPRLLFSRREADSISRVSPKNLSLKKVDFAASKEGVFNSGLEQYRIVHFATHGLLNSRHAELSGVVLSLVDKNGGDVDGFLRLQDIYNLKLSAALVVLSACNSALGKDVKGEGLLGLTRGFMYPGAPRVVASEFPAKADQNQSSKNRIEEKENRAPVVSTIILPLGTTRGGAAKTFVLPAKTDVVNLQLKFEEGDFKEYLVVLETVEGRQIWSGRIPKPATNEKAVNARIPARLLRKGDYIINLKGLNADGVYESIADYAFTIDRR